MANIDSNEPRRPEVEKDAATVLVELLNPSAWIPPAHAKWVPVIEALMEAFLRHFDQAVLARLLDDQRALPPSATSAERAVRMASGLTALHKLCQMLARNPRLPAEARATLAPLESLPAQAIPDSAVSAAVALAMQARPDLELDTENPKVARGSVADVFRFRHRTSFGKAIAFKTVRTDSLVRIRNETDILMQMAKDCSAVSLLAGPNFATTLAEALRDAAVALLREIDFAGEATNLRDARAFYRFNRRVYVPGTIGEPIDRGLFMEFVEGVPLLDAPLDSESRRDAARLVFRRLILDPLFSGLSESIFHADPHAGNLMVQTHKYSPFKLVLLDWSQAGRLSASLRYAVITLCLSCVTGEEPSPEVLARLLETDRMSIRIPLPQDAGDPLHAAFEIVQQLALQGHPVPLDLLLLRKSFLALDGITRQLDPEFSAWRETLAYGAGVFASEAVVRTWSIQFPWIDRPEFYRSGLPTRTLAAHFWEMIRKLLCKCKKTGWHIPRIDAIFN
ncbi:MAG TPA: AarF/UbiB family protein [Chthoniobacterales bacterium]|nr:AarF/UbiB family protein [Chthoniobacterales bacterium]